MASKLDADKIKAKKSGGFLGKLQDMGKAKIKSASDTSGGGARKKAIDAAIVGKSKKK